MESETSFLGLMQKDIKNRQVLGLLPKWFSSFIFTFAMWECADQQQLQLKSLKGLRVKHSLRNHYATQKSSLVCLCLRVAVKGRLLHTSWIKLFWEYRTLTSAIAHILPSCLFFSWEACQEKKNTTRKSMRQDRESECVRAFDTSVESLCHRLDFSVVTNASNDLLDSENQTYCIPGTVCSRPPCCCRVEPR